MTSMPEQHQFAAQTLGESFEREFRRVVGAHERRRILSADRGDHDDAPRADIAVHVRHQKRREGLRHDQLPGDVHFQLMAEFVDVEIEKRARHRDAGIVHEAEQRPSLEHLGRLLGGFDDRARIGHVEHQGHEIRPELGLQPVGVGLFADTAENPNTLLYQYLGDTPADPGRRTRDDDAPVGRFHSHPLRIMSLGPI